jgi:hypothetical protein
MRACNAEPGGKDGRAAAVELFEAADASIESGDKLVVGACGFSVFVKGSNFGLSRGISFSANDGPTAADLDAGAGISSCV